MKLPAVWILAAFASGIAMRWPSSPKLWAAGAIVAIVAGAILAWCGFSSPAWIFALLAWVAVCGFSSGVEHFTVSKNHITQLVAQRRIDLSVPLRWRGRLREDPMALPWGHRYEIDLEQVEAAGEIIPVSGGLRLNFYSGTHAADPPADLRAGYRIEALAKAKPPRNFLDPGAIDIRGMLALEGVDLLGSLRSGDLLQVIDRPPPTISQRLARARGNLLARLDSLFVEQPESGAVLRAMLLGDRSFVDTNVVEAFRKPLRTSRAACWRAGCVFAMGGPAIADARIGNQRCGVSGVARLCGNRAGSSADSAGCADGCAVSAGTPAIPSR
jgi:predicted membrane metal-binding protein